MAGHDILVNVSTALANASDFGFGMPAEVEHFLGHPDVLHIFALFLGIIAITSVWRFPQVLASVASLSFGLWLGLVVQDRQQFDQPILGSVHLPKGAWLAMLVAWLGCTAAGVLAMLMWRIALALLNAGMLMLLSLAICRLANTSPEKVIKIGASLLSTYRLVGGIVLFISFGASIVGVVFFEDAMVSFTAASLGSLLVLSGISHFAQRLGAAQRPFSLLDDLARMLSEVRGGRCYLWSRDEVEDSGIRGCDCSDHCRTEIVFWIVSSLGFLLTCQYIKRRYNDSLNRYKKAANEDELQPLACGEAAVAARETELPAHVVGRQRV